MSLEFQRFLKYYNPYVNPEWRSHYFHYDTLKNLYKTIKEGKPTSLVSSPRASQAEISKTSVEITAADLQAFEKQYFNEIRRVYDFVQSTFADLASDLHMLQSMIETNNMPGREHHVERDNRNIELSLRSLYDKVKDLEVFYHLNYYSICKISKKMEKLMQMYGKTQQKLLKRAASSASPNTSTSATSFSRLNGVATVASEIKEVEDLEGYRSEVEPSFASSDLSTQKSKFNLANESKASGTTKLGSNLAAVCSDNSDGHTDQEQRLSTVVLTRGTSTSKASKEESQPQWKDTISGQFFLADFTDLLATIEGLKQSCIDTYAQKYRITYSQLAKYELEFVKFKDKHYEPTNFFLGAKIGLILLLLIWIINDSNYYAHSSFNFWQQPGLFVYATVGNLLLYRVCWGLDIFIWSKFDISYISILCLNDIKPNILMVSDQTATLLLLYFVNLILFFKANTTYSFLRHSFLSYACPMLLILVSIVYQLYEYFVLFGNERISRGLFNLQVLWNLVKAPTIAVSFRDVYSADVLTSFTRIIADSMYAICWVISGTFLIPVDRKDSHMDLHNFGSDYMSCTNPTMYTFVSYIQLIPLITRALQCLRSFRDQNYSVYPQGYNCLKYLSSILVVVVGLQSNVNVGMYICLIIFSTIYKWWWDVAMDWGLFDNLPSNVWEFLEVWNYPRKRIFLRSSLMYPSVYLYYFCILLDLVLRLLWVLSLVPATLLGSLVGYQLSLFVGSMEIIRRCMWGFLRVEYEHLKMLRQQTPGFLPNRVVRKSVDHGKEGTIAQPPFHIKNKQNKDSRLNLRKIVPSEIELSGGGNNAGMTSPNRYKAFPSQNVAMDADRGNLVALFQDLDDSERVEKMSDEEEEGSYIV